MVGKILLLNDAGLYKEFDNKNEVIKFFKDSNFNKEDIYELDNLEIIEFIREITDDDNGETLNEYEYWLDNEDEPVYYEYKQLNYEINVKVIDFTLK